jgi:uncharacterized protein YutE (UPF0331/DUF86 family)
MIDDIDINKAAIIRRCLARVHHELGGNPAALDHFTTQDAIVLNILRACEAAIDLAMHRVSLGSYGIPQSSREAFDLLEKNSVISAPCASSMKNMVGFRNVAVHSYQELQMPILQAIVRDHLTDFETFLAELHLP